MDRFIQANLEARANESYSTEAAATSE